MSWLNARLHKSDRQVRRESKYVKKKCGHGGMQVEFEPLWRMDRREVDKGRQADPHPAWQLTVATTRSPGASMLWPCPRIAVTSCVTSRAEAVSKRARRSRMSEFWFRTLQRGGGVGSDAANHERTNLSTNRPLRTHFPPPLTDRLRRAR